MTATAEEVDEECEEETAAAQAPNHDPEAEGDEEEKVEVEDDEAFMSEAMAVAYKSAKAKLREKKKARGFQASPEAREARARSLESLKASTPCRDCGQKGHWSGDQECPKSRGHKQVSFVYLATTPKSMPAPPPRLLSDAIGQLAPQSPKPVPKALPKNILQALPKAGSTTSVVKVPSTPPVVEGPPVKCVEKASPKSPQSSTSSNLTSTSPADELPPSMEVKKGSDKTVEEYRRQLQAVYGAQSRGSGHG